MKVVYHPAVHETFPGFCAFSMHPFSNEQSIAGELNQRKDDGGEQWQQQIHIDWPAIVLKSLLVFKAAK